MCEIACDKVAVLRRCESGRAESVCVKDKPRAHQPDSTILRTLFDCLLLLLRLPQLLPPLLLPPATLLFLYSQMFPIYKNHHADMLAVSRSLFWGLVLYCFHCR